MRPLTVIALVLLAPAVAAAQKVYLNPSNQTANAVSGGGNEAQYALINANLAKAKLDGWGFTARVDQDFTNAPANANSWGADIFVSIHTNAGGGHGIETLYKTTAGRAVADAVQNGLLGALPYQNRGLKVRTDLHVLNNTSMPACLTEALFHDCSSASGFTGHPPAESAYLKSASGQEAISTGIAKGVCAYYSKACSTVPPQKGTVKGVVYKNPTLTDRIAGATVTVQGGASQVYDGTNVWSFDLDPGTYTINATAPGYKPGSKSAVVVAGQTAWASIGLDPAAVQNGKIQGFVYEQPDLQAKLAGAKVDLSSGATATYDGAKDFVFDVSPGDYTLAVSAAGFAAGQATAKVASGATVTANVGLVRLGGEDASVVAPGLDAEISQGGDASSTDEADVGHASGADASGPSGSADAGTVPLPPKTGACGCASAGAGAVLAGLPLLALVAVRRRRR